MLEQAVFGSPLKHQALKTCSNTLPFTRQTKHSRSRETPTDTFIFVRLPDILNDKKTSKKVWKNV